MYNIVIPVYAFEAPRSQVGTHPTMNVWLGWCPHHHGCLPSWLPVLTGHLQLLERLLLLLPDTNPPTRTE